ncbi:hypothetical protein GKZ28_01660 [Clostridium chromiireducens]|uniref:Uncharacterized protein n=1 Tax=Clostridium chromiireducens TaxID=225345 RepID=A0A964W0V5_9CLOT|nr:hypothetical protein [Clostridium chromiireducens]MVX62407.1 hypothetical protein [Clostridium chromiireducens]
MAIEEKINDVLLSNYSVGLDEVKENVKKYLIDIEKYISEVENKLLFLNNEYIELKLTKTKIVSEIKIARQTYYNNKSLLEKYMDIRIEELEKINLLNKYKEMKESSAELNEKLYKASIRDVREQILMDKIEAKDNEIKELLNINKQLSKRIDVLMKENQKYKMNDRNDVINFPVKK